MAPSAPNSVVVKAAEYKDLVENAGPTTDVNGIVASIESQELAEILGLDTLGSPVEARRAMFKIQSLATLDRYSTNTSEPEKARLASQIRRITQDVYLITTIINEPISDFEKYHKYPDWYRAKIAPPGPPPLLVQKAKEYEDAITNTDASTDIPSFIANLMSMELYEILGLSKMPNHHEALQAIKSLTANILRMTTLSPEQTVMQHQILGLLNDVLKIIETNEKPIDDLAKFAEYPMWYQNKLRDAETAKQNKKIRNRVRNKVKNVSEAFGKKKEAVKRAVENASERILGKSYKFNPDDLELLDDAEAIKKANLAITTVATDLNQAIIYFAELQLQTSIDLTSFRSELYDKIGEYLAAQIHADFSRSSNARLKINRDASGPELKQGIYEKRLIDVRESILAIAEIAEIDPNPIMASIQRTAFQTILYEVQKFEANRDHEKLREVEDTTRVIYAAISNEFPAIISPEQNQKLLRILFKPYYQDYLDGKLTQEQLSRQLSTLASGFNMPDVTDLKRAIKYNPESLQDLFT